MKYKTIATAKAILKIRTSRGLNQYELARLLKISDDTIAAWENGRNTISNASRDKIATVLTKDEMSIIEEAILEDKLNRKSQNVETQAK